MSGTETRPTGTRRVQLKVAGHSFGPWTEVEIVRDLSEISGSFRLSYHDAARAGRALGRPAPRTDLMALQCGQPCDVEIDGELVLRGWIDDVELDWQPDAISAVVTGRDRTGDLVDCAATVDGPAEYLGVTLEEIARRICAPFGIAVRAEVPAAQTRFDRFSIDVAETAMSALEKATRQAAVLLTSDGVGALVLTRSGTRRAPDALRMPGSVTSGRARLSWRERFSLYVYKGQQEGDGRSRSGGPAMDSTANPLTGAPSPSPAVVAPEARGIIRTGRATDAEVTRYRPRVRLVRTESAGSSAQEQADWLMRVARGRSEGLAYVVPDWRAGPEGEGASGSTRRRLWRPNELVPVVDLYAGIDRDMLIGGVTWRYGQQGSTTEIRVVGPEAYDRIREDARRRIVTRAVDDSGRGDSLARRLPGDRRAEEGDR